MLVLLCFHDLDQRFGDQERQDQADDGVRNQVGTVVHDGIQQREIELGGADH